MLSASLAAILYPPTFLAAQAGKLDGRARLPPPDGWRVSRTPERQPRTAVLGHHTMPWA